MAGGMGTVRQMPYTHWISYILILASTDAPALQEMLRHEDTPRFPLYWSTLPQDRRCGPQRVIEAVGMLPQEVRDRVGKEDEVLLQAEATLLPEGVD